MSEESAAQESTENGSQNSKTTGKGLTTDEEVLLMNIDYFEQWDRVFQKFHAQEQEVLSCMKMHGISMI